MSKLGDKVEFKSHFGTESSKTKRRKSIRQEDRLAALEGGRRIPYSGGKREKGDAEYAGFKFECKRTNTKSIRIDEKIIGKIFREALAAGMDFAIQVDVDGFESNQIPNRFVILREESFIQLIEDGRRDDDQTEG